MSLFHCVLFCVTCVSTSTNNILADIFLHLYDGQQVLAICVLPEFIIKIQLHLSVK